MKSNFLFFMIIVVLGSCAAGVKKDLLTGLTVTNNGLSYDNVYLTSDGNELQSTEFSMGQKIVIQLEGVDGFQLKDGMAFAGASLVVEDNAGNVVLELNDLLASYNETGIKPEDAKFLSANFTVGDPIELNKPYKLIANFWDNNSESDIICKVDFTVKN
jgi:hypothetical protein